MGYPRNFVSRTLQAAKRKFYALTSSFSENKLLLKIPGKIDRIKKNVPKEFIFVLTIPNTTKKIYIQLNLMKKIGIKVSIKY